MYVAVKGGERAIRNAHALLADARRGKREVPQIAPEQIEEQLSLGVDRVMSEGSLYDRRVAALAIKQARGDLIEAIFLTRAYRTTLPRFARGYGLVFGQSERKAMSMALVDRALRADEFTEERKGPAQDEEFVLSHSDNVQATGFVEHLKLPHYVDFQAELALLRQLRREWDGRKEAAE